MDEESGVEWVESVDTLDLLESDVFTLAELDDVLDTVNDLETTLSIDLSNVTGVEPAVNESLVGVLGVVEVSLEDVGSADADLTTGRGRVLVGVAHLGDVLEADFIARLDHAGGAHVGRVLSNSLGAGADSLSETVALDNVTAEADTEQLVNGSREGSSTRRHVQHFATDESTQLAEDEGVVDAVSDGAGCAVVGELGGDGAAEKSTLESGGAHLHLDGRVNTVPDTRNPWEHVGLEELSIFKELGGVASGKADDTITVHDENLEEALVAVVSIVF